METVYGANGDYTGHPALQVPARGRPGPRRDRLRRLLHRLRPQPRRRRRRHPPHPRRPRPRGRTARRFGTHRGRGAHGHAPARRPREGRPPRLHLRHRTAIPLPQGQPWAVNLIDENSILADARAARRAGADVVVVSLHWGTEWQDAPDRQQLALAQRAHRRPHRRPPRRRPDPRHPRPRPAGVREGQRHLGRLRHGRPDRRRDVRQRGRPGPARQPSPPSAASPSPRPPGRAALGVTKAEFVPQMFDVDAGRVVNLNQAIAPGRRPEGRTRPRSGRWC